MTTLFRSVTHSRNLNSYLALVFAAALMLLSQASGAQTYTSESIHVGGLDRTFLVHDFSGEGPAPTVLLLHGAGGNGENMAFMSEFDEVAAEEGIIAVYPEGTSLLARFLTWNATHCCAYAMHNDIDDVGFISALIDELIASGRADPERIYVAGLSNGAMLTHVLGRELPDKIAAIGTVVGNVWGGELLPQGSVPAIIINGELDTIVPPKGGPIGGGSAGSLFSNAADADAAPAGYQYFYWALANQCKSARFLKDQIAHTVLISGCANKANVDYHLVLGNGHAWPGGRAAREGADQPVQTFDASQVIWDFFEEHPKGWSRSGHCPSGQF